MMLNNRLAVYLFRIAQAVKQGKYVNASMVCPECEKNAEDIRHDGEHIVICQKEEGVDLYYVVIGCEGYWTVNPNDYGVPSPNWTSPADYLDKPEPDETNLATYANYALGWKIDELPMDEDNKRELSQTIHSDPTISDKAKLSLMRQLKAH